jgi:ATPase family protein associated with various cellular activities (AAA)
MATAAPPIGLERQEASRELARQWRMLSRAATVVMLLATPAVYLYLNRQLGWNWRWALVGTFGAVVVVRGLFDVFLRRVIPWPSLFGTDEARLREEDVLARRRAWFWRKWVRRAAVFLGAVTVVWMIYAMTRGFDDADWVATVTGFWTGAWGVLRSPAAWAYALIFPILFLFNFVILFGPLLAVGVTQIQGTEPGDADWGVKLDDVRGQAEAKEEVRRVVELWQSGEAFEAAGGKRERGLLFLGAPGTGKTMLSKAIATGFNAPFVSVPARGSRRRSSAWTRSSSAGWRGRRSGSRGSGAGSASSSSTRSMRSAGAAISSAARALPAAAPAYRRSRSCRSTARGERSTRAAT